VDLSLPWSNSNCCCASLYLEQNLVNMWKDDQSASHDARSLLLFSIGLFFKRDFDIWRDSVLGTGSCKFERRWSSGGGPSPPTPYPLPRPLLPKVMAHTWMLHVTRVNKPCRTHEYGAELVISFRLQWWLISFSLCVVLLWNITRRDTWMCDTWMMSRGSQCYAGIAWLPNYMIFEQTQAFLSISFARLVCIYISLVHTCI